MENYFIHDDDFYQRDLNLMKHYCQDAATYLQKRTGKPLDQCMAFVKERVQQQAIDPEMVVFLRNKHGDREKKVISFTDYLRSIEEENRILAPTMTLYKHPEEQRSILGEFIEENIRRRSQSKKEMFQAKDAVTRTYKDNEQSAFKISNNSLSGAQGSVSTVLYNKTAHSSLTSTCRTATSYGNANNEKFLQGNRHYWSPDIVKANILSIISHSDYSEIQKAMETYGLHYPDVEQTMAVVIRSTQLYWKNAPNQVQLIEQLIESLSPIERAAFVYTGDFYHLSRYNESFVKTFLTRLTEKATNPVDNPDDYIGSIDSDLKMYISLLCASMLDGKSLSECKETNPTVYGLIGATAKSIIECLEHYQWLIKGFWRARTLPASVSHIRSSLRRCVVTSDTDSTIFTTQDWVSWYQGEVRFDEQSNAVAYAVTYLVTQTIQHVLATVSSGINVERKHLKTLSMKNEYSFPVFSLTSSAKHYFAFISAREGHVYKDYPIEVKGVHLIDSNVPKSIMNQFRDTIKETMNAIIAGEGIYVTALIEKIQHIENGVLESIKRGDPEFLSTRNVKRQDAYKNAHQSPYQYFELWEAVFAPDYGNAPQPPFRAVSVSLDLHNRTKLTAWLDQLPNQALAMRMRQWCEERNKKGMTSILLPKANIDLHGVPGELISAMNLRRLIYHTTRPFYSLLEALGVYLFNENLTKLASDVYPGDSVVKTIQPLAGPTVQ